MKILLMEDDPVLGEIIHDYLEQFYETTRVFDSKEAFEFIGEESYDLFIFDINVPGISGIKLLEDLRSFNNQTPVIIITAYEDTKHMKSSFDTGAHDYIKKPFDLEELKLRIDKSKILFHIEQEEAINIDTHIIFYPSKRVIETQDKTYSLKPKEMEILKYFISHKHRLISQDELIQNIWEFDNMPSDATLRSYIRKLREMLGAEKITTQRGSGYRYE